MHSRFRLAVALTAIVLTSELTPMELTLVYPSLRCMAADFPTPHIAWVLTIVSLSAVVSIPLTGKLADTYGKRRALLGLGTTVVGLVAVLMRHGRAPAAGGAACTT
ncbi:hypothetical protein ACFZBU_11820 [Embleya sp. NPDC008237]|uniref:hypothetical protein n=1 Tax=Embleya sp. NPDC008237 TaxID=3363978 RepID=UPI0036EBA58F